MWSPIVTVTLGIGAPSIAFTVVPPTDAVAEDALVVEEELAVVVCADGASGALLPHADTTRAAGIKSDKDRQDILVPFRCKGHALRNR